MSDTVITNPVADSYEGLGSEQVSSVGDFFLLLKPRVMSLVVFTGLVGLVIAPGALHPVLAIVAILCIAVGSGAAGAINMWYDRDIDAVMERTADRPIPAGRVVPDDALVFGGLLSLFSVGLLGLTTNWVAAGLLGSAILFYVFVYTMWLKRRTPQNIVIGGAAGAFPPLIGWAAVTGDVAAMPLVLFAIVFFWTPPHFWALALFRSGDYGRAGIPMLPVVAGRRTTKAQMLAYTLLLLPLSVSPYFFGAAGPIYAAGVALLGLLFIVCAVRVWREPEHAGDRCARQMFGFSILYLFLLFALLPIDLVMTGGGL